MLAKFVEAGAALPLDELIDKYGKNVKKRFESYFPMWRDQYTDGKLYVVQWLCPYKEPLFVPELDMMVRSDALEAAGWPELVTTTQWLNFFKESLKRFPTTDGQKTVGLSMPLADTGYTLSVNIVELAQRGIYPRHSPNLTLFDTKTKKYFNAFTADEYKQSVKFYNECYRAGIINDETFTDSYTQNSEKLRTGRALAAFFTLWEVDPANAALANAGKEKMQYVRLPIRLDSQVQKDEVRPLHVILSGGNEIITKNAKDPVRLMKLLDYFATDEGQVLLGWGVEGQHYTVDAKTKKRVLTETFWKEFRSDPNYYAHQGMHWWGPSWLLMQVDADKNGQALQNYYSAELLIAGATARTKEVLSKYGWTSPLDPWRINPKNKIFEWGDMAFDNTSLDPTSDAGKLATLIDETRVRALPSLIKAKDDAEFDKLWNDLKSSVAQMGIDKVIDAYNVTYQERVKAYSKMGK